MNFRMLKEAWISLAANKLRSFLTILGIIIGVCAVVMMVAAGQTAENFISTRLSSMGSNLIIVIPGSAQSGGVRGGFGTGRTLTLEDAEAIATISSIYKVAPLVTSSAQFVAGNNNWSASVTGATPDYLEVGNWTLQSGSNFTERDSRIGTTYALLGSSLAEKLFGDVDPLGQSIRIRNVPFVVGGVLAPKGQSIDGRDQDDTAIVPLKTVGQRIYSTRFPNRVNVIMVQVKEGRSMDAAVTEITSLLRERHRLRTNQEDDFSVRNLTSLAETVQTVSLALSLLLAAIASISLLVGSIGIMNMMLVSVTERTREIGIRKAVGAPGRAILLQFLLESILISTIGSLVGLVLGLSFSWAVGNFLGYPVLFSVWPIVMALVVAVLVGVLSGIFPALKATRLDPIEALRHQ